MKKGPNVWNRNEDGSITFKLVKSASTTLIQDDKVAVQVTFLHKPTDDPKFKPESVQFILPVAAAKELAGYIQNFADKNDLIEPESSTLH